MDVPESRQIVIAGAGYAGLHIALRLGAWLDAHPEVSLTLVDRNDYHQVLTELPRVAAGSRSAEQVRVPLETVLNRRVRFVLTDIIGFDLPEQHLLTGDGSLPYEHLVLALGSRPNDFQIPGLAERVLFLWSVSEAETVWEAVQRSVDRAAATSNEEERHRLLTAVIGGAGATGVELAGALAETLPELARERGLPTDATHVVLVEAGPTILPGSSPQLIDRAHDILRKLGVEVRTNAVIARATPEGFQLREGTVVTGSVFVWAGGVKAQELTHGCGLAVDHNGRIKVDEYLRALDHPEIYVAGDLAVVFDPETGRALPPLAQIALAEGETVARNLQAEIERRPLESFRFRDKGFVVSVGGARGVADIAGRTIGGRLAHVLKDAIEWEYRQSVKHLRGWSAV